MTHKLTHPSVLATGTAGAVLAIAATQTHVPLWLWGVWAALGAVAVTQAVRSNP